MRTRKCAVKIVLFNVAEQLSVKGDKKAKISRLP